MAEGMITAGTQPQWFEEEESPIAKAIGTLLMQMRAGGISMQQAAEFFADMERRGVPRQVIEDIMDRPETGVRQDIASAPVNRMPTDVKTAGPTMPTYGDVRSVLDPGPSNIRVDQPDIGWPGEDFRKFPKAEVKKTAPPMGNDFGAPPVNRNPVGRAAPPVSSYVRPASSFIHEDIKAAARSRGRTTPQRQVTQNPDPSGLIRTFGGGGGYSGNTAAVIQDAGYQSAREARRRPTYNRVPKSTPSGSSGGRRSSGPWRLLA